MNRAGITMVEIGVLKSKITRQLTVFEKRRETILEAMELLREQLELDEFSKEYEKLRLEFDVLTTANRIVNDNLVIGDQRCATLLESDRPRQSWEEYRIERQETLCELEELYHMVKLTLDRTVERSAARRASADRSGARSAPPISAVRESARSDIRQNSTTTIHVAQLEQGTSDLRATVTDRRELDESFDNFETVPSRVNSGNNSAIPQAVPTFDVRLDRGHFKLTLPIFDGKHWEWDRFWSQYVLHIDSQNYPDSVKLNILRSHLAGEALDLLDTGSQDGVDLEGGKRALKFHYDNESVKKAAILSKIEEVPRSTNLSANLSKTFSELKRLIRSLQKYEEVNTAHMRRTVRMKLPRAAVVALKEREDAFGREWSTDELLNALECYISTRRLDETHEDYEKVWSSTAVATNKPKVESLPVKKPNIASELTTSPTPIPNPTVTCTLCNLRNHTADVCRKTNFEQTELAVRQNNLCRKCLSAGHRATNCRADPCSFCGGQHSVKLCRAKHGVPGSAGGGNYGSGREQANASGTPNNRAEGTGLNYQAARNGSGKPWNKGKFSNSNNSNNPSRGQEPFRN